MIKAKIAFIGGGNMAYAIAKNIIANGLVKPGEITISDLNKERLEFLNSDLGVNVTGDNNEAIQKSDIIILAIKPQIFRKAHLHFTEALGNKCVISIMAGVTIEELEGVLPNSVHILRTMPNMPAMAGEGMTALCNGNNLTEDETQIAEKIFKSVGRVCYIEENLIDAFIGISGSGPAYVFMFIEALADAGVLHGLPRDLAYEVSTQLMKGSAAVIQESRLHPGELKDMVCSPGGTTIEAVKSLEKNGFRGVVIEAVDECVEKAKRL